MTTEAQRRAAANYRARNANRARLPGVFLTPEEAELLDELAEIYGTKRDAIIEGLKMLAKAHKMR
ncbi:hypothetical protein [Mixta intestinalis]|uniref:Uncharacterized protein n=1 Tax=Mixta intestinalis TaxID=1615494 RepID=A0A6P1Q4G4_9GAMM|nr:hypothetical protein [Mixta intestinalis]QHM73252.1 hypothetical protein C7M51_03597 [Mixta intestinalis]